MHLDVLNVTYTAASSMYTRRSFAGSAMMITFRIVFTVDIFSKRQIRLKTTDIIRFAQLYRAPKRRDCYEYEILNITSQSL